MVTEREHWCRGTVMSSRLCQPELAAAMAREATVEPESVRGASRGVPKHHLNQRLGEQARSQTSSKGIKSNTAEIDATTATRKRHLSP